MALQKLLRKLLLLPLLGGPLGALADPIYSLTLLPQDFFASGINNAGQQIADLGLLGGVRARALGINNAGLIVGASERSNDQPFDFHTFLYANHVKVELNNLIDPASGRQIVSAKDINDAQQILATACKLGECTSVRLDLIPTVPEPKVWGMLLAGLALIASRRRRVPRTETFR